MRVGTGATLSVAATPISLITFDPYIHEILSTVDMPSTGASACTVSGTTALDGAISLSVSGSTIMLPCRRVDAGGTIVAASANVIARIDYAGVDTSFDVSDAPAADFTSVVSHTGNEAWLATPVGVHYVATPGSASTLISPATVSARCLYLDAAGELWAASTSGATRPFSGLSFPSSLPTTVATAALLTASSIASLVVQNSTAIWFRCGRAGGGAGLCLG